MTFLTSPSEHSSTNLLTGWKSVNLTPVEFRYTYGRAVTAHSIGLEHQLQLVPTYRSTESAFMLPDNT